jgi:hypothetical protein
LVPFGLWQGSPPIDEDLGILPRWIGRKCQEVPLCARESERPLPMQRQWADIIARAQDRTACVLVEARAEILEGMEVDETFVLYNRIVEKGVNRTYATGAIPLEMITSIVCESCDYVPHHWWQETIGGIEYEFAALRKTNATFLNSVSSVVPYSTDTVVRVALKPHSYSIEAMVADLPHDHSKVRATFNLGSQLIKDELRGIAIDIRNDMLAENAPDPLKTMPILRGLTEAQRRIDLVLGKDQIWAHK